MLGDLLFYLKKFFKKFWYLVFMGVALLIFLTFATDKKSLNVYQDGSKNYTIATERESEKKIETVRYNSDKIRFSMEIPAGWDYVLKDGYDTYIHSASATSLQVQILDYYPQVNNTTEESLYRSYMERGLSLTEFNFTADNSYYAISQKSSLAGITDYIETVIWDRGHVLKLVVTVNDAHYNKLSDAIWHCIDSVSWDYEEPLLPGAYLQYMQDGDFEFAVPTGWAVGDTGDAFYAYDPEVSAEMSVCILEDASSIADVTQIDYANFLSSGKENFALTQFQQNQNIIMGAATYIRNGVQKMLLQKYIADGTYHYAVTYEFPSELAADYGPFCSDCLGMVRVFHDLQQGTMEEKEMPQTEWSDSWVREKMGSVPAMDEPAQSQNPGGQPETASFADALVEVAGIPYRNAEEISGIWDSLNIGTPVYAEAVQQVGGTLVVGVETDQQYYYFLYILEDGTLGSIHDGDANGPTIWG